jgi:hypothetical protein
MLYPPYPFALFSLFPYRDNKQAKRAVAYINNIHYVLTLSNSVKAFNIGFHIRGKLLTTFITLKRGVKADIYVKGSSIIKI